MRMTLVATTTAAVALLLGVAVPAVAQQGGQQTTVATKFCVIPYKAAGVPGAGTSSTLPVADFADGTINCTNSRAGQEVALSCSTILLNYTGSSFQGTAPCAIDECGTKPEPTLATGTLKISKSGNVNFDCKIGKGK